MWIVKRICPVYIKAKETDTVKWGILQEKDKERNNNDVF